MTNTTNTTNTTVMTGYICNGCGTQFDPSTRPPTGCVVCSDDRQYVARGGQTWTTHAELADGHVNRIEPDGDLVGIGISPGFAIPQRALLVPTPSGNIMWDCVSLVTPGAVAEIEARGGITAIAISHPHFYASMVEWSDAFGGVPIHLHRADAGWIQRRSENIVLWDGDDVALTDAVRLLHLPGHFPGSAALHWTGHPAGRSVLLAGDSLHVADDLAHVTVMHSVPNYIPVGPAVIRDLRDRLDGVEFDDLYGFTWGRNIIDGARSAVEVSLARYLDIVAEPARSN